MANPEGQESDSDDLFPHVQMQQVAAMQGIQTHGGPNPPQPIPQQVAVQTIPKSSPQSTNAMLHQHIQSSSVSPTAANMYAITTQNDQPSTKIYLIVLWRILIYALLLYSVFGVTYLLFINPTTNSDCPCSTTSAKTSSDLSVLSNAPTQNPSSLPTESPSITIIAVDPAPNPTQNPVVAPTESPSPLPTNLPTQLPTKSPSESPTEYYEKYNHYIGDYKVSVQSSDHGNWLLCDGSVIDSRDYPLLFAEIGTVFGSSGTFGFRLPDLTDKVIGISGISHEMGDILGSETETFTLSQANIPTHYHWMANSGGCTGDYSSSTRPYLADYCRIDDYSSTSGGGENYRYEIGATLATPNQYRTSEIGSGSSVTLDIMNPTVYAGNLFIFAM